MVLKSDNYCEGCDNKYTNTFNYWCKPCQINSLKENFKNWTSGNKQIDDFIQEMQLKINFYDDLIFEWVPYIQFDDIKEIIKIDSATVHSAIWKDGPLEYDKDKMEYIKSQNKNVALKCLHNSQNISNELLLNEV
jgi:hypothetical protein